MNALNSGFFSLWREADIHLILRINGCLCVGLSSVKQMPCQFENGQWAADRWFWIS